MFKILVCDDDKEIVEAIEIYLTQEGYEVLKAYDGEEAIQTLKKEHVDLLIMDVMMPRLDGIRATLKIREENSLPIIISVSYTHLDVYKRQVQYPVVDIKVIISL